MNFLNLEYFLVAAEELNFTKAANKLFISQQALTSHIKKLEEYFGAELFDRVPPMTLTNEGLCLVRRSRQMLTLKDETLKEIGDIKDFTKADLTVGIPISRGRLILPEIMEVYSRKFPNVQLHVLEGTTSQVEEALHKGQIDLNIGFIPQDMTQLSREFLCMDKLVAVIPDSLLKECYSEEFQLLKKRLELEVDVRLIKKCPFLMMKGNTRTGTICRNIFSSAGIAPRIVLESGNIETLLALCFRGVGIVFCPEVYYTESFKSFNAELFNQIHAYPISYSEAKKEIVISYLKDKYMTQAAKEFIAVAKACMQG